ncbi:MAG: epoxyqueuosine reductase QueH [Nitrospinota bacterium]
MINDRSILLHTCCAPCSPYVVQELSKNYRLSLYYYNPNIHPIEEYEKRFEELSRWSQNLGVKLYKGEYDIESWFKIADGLEDEPEKGKRCINCFELRLKETARKGSELSFDYYGTVMTVSPHKDAVVINEIGNRYSSLNGSKFLEANWKKKDGFKITTELSDKLNFYRQKYCGCVYSKNKVVGRAGRLSDG